MIPPRLLLVRAAEWHPSGGVTPADSWVVGKRLTWEYDGHDGADAWWVTKGDDGSIKLRVRQSSLRFLWSVAPTP